MSKERSPDGCGEEVELWIHQHQVTPRAINRLAKVIDQLGIYRLPNSDHQEDPLSQQSVVSFEEGEPPNN